MGSTSGKILLPVSYHQVGPWCIRHHLHEPVSNSQELIERGSSNAICLARVFSTFFKLGQTLETFRGRGIYQASVDEAIEKLNMGHWVRHL